jgi:diamine N-acetyltransferase
MLKVKEEQFAVFPAPVVYWIAESKFIDEFVLRAVYLDEEIIGFIVYCAKPDKDDNYWILAVMIGEKHQGKGYGKEAMKQLVEQMCATLNCKRIMVGHRPNNQAASQLYESLGFKKVTDEVVDGEIIRLFQIV